MYSLHFSDVLLTVHHSISVQQHNTMQYSVDRASQYISTTAQHDVLFACTLLRFIASTCFEHLFGSSSGGTVCTAVGIFCVYCVGWLLAGLEWNKEVLKTVEAINRNKLKANSGSCWCCYTGTVWILRPASWSSGLRF
jgi:hypothetical protein